MYNSRAVKYYEQGRVHHQSGKLSAAERAYKKAIRINAEFVEAVTNLGNVHLDQGQLKKASVAYGKALKIHPDHPMLLNNLGNALQRQGENEKAIGWLNEAISQDPNYADAHCNLGNALRDLGRCAQAVTAYKQAIKLNPGLADAYYNLASVLLELDQLDDAVSNYHTAIERNPGHHSAYVGLGNALSIQGELDQAIDAFETAAEIDPDNKNPHIALGKALSDAGDIDRAVVAYGKAIEIDPADKLTYMGLANALSDHGVLGKAITAYRSAIKIDAEFAEAYRHLAHNRKFIRHDDDIEAMESLLSSGGLPDEKIVHLGFALGKAYEDLGAYEKSMNFVLEANRLKRASFDFSISEEQVLFTRIKETFSLDFFAKRKEAGFADNTPIFIVGMPRSGTSLVEQILASHPAVFGAGELTILPELAKEVCAAGPSGKFPGGIIELDTDTLVDAGREYIRSIRNYSKRAQFITDKLPPNFLRIGFIRAILPNARIIHCTREPMDNCLSIFKNYLWTGHPYSDNLTELGQYYNLYLDLMAHWRRTLPCDIYDLNYENLVTDQETQTRRLINFCNLKWDDGCLDFHTTRRKVKTISNTQVRQPVNTNSVGLWKRYENQLSPLMAEIFAQ